MQADDASKADADNSRLADTRGIVEYFCDALNDICTWKVFSQTTNDDVGLGSHALLAVSRFWANSNSCGMSAVSG